MCACLAATGLPGIPTAPHTALARTPRCAVVKVDKPTLNKASKSSKARSTEGSPADGSVAGAAQAQAGAEAEEEGQGEAEVGQAAAAEAEAEQPGAA